MRSVLLALVLCCTLTVESRAVPVRALGCSYRTTTSTSSNPTTLWDIDLTTGAGSNPRTLRAPTGSGTFVNCRSISDIAMGPDGFLYGMDDHYAGANADAIRLKDTFVRIDPVTGYVTRVGDVFPIPPFPSGTYVYEGDLAFQPGTGTLYSIFSANAQATLFTINTSTGAATLVSAMNGLAITDASAMTFGPDGSLWVVDTGYATSGANPVALLWKLDPVTGAVIDSKTVVDASGAGVSLGQTAGMEYDPVTGYYFIGDGDYNGTNFLYRLDVTSGLLTTVGDTGIVGGWASGYNKGGGLSGLTIVPEPTALALALAGVLALRRR